MPVLTGNHINKATQGDPQQFTRKKGPFPGKARPQNKAFTGNIIVLLHNKNNSLFYENILQWTYKQNIWLFWGSQVWARLKAANVIVLLQCKNNVYFTRIFWNVYREMYIGTKWSQAYRYEALGQLSQR